MKKINLRTISQILVVLIILVLAFAHQKWGIEKAAPVDAYCPFGALESLITTITTGTFLQRTYISNYILLIVFIIMTILFGRVFCGFFCPFGAIQEWLRSFGRKIGIKKDYELPKSIDKIMRYFKYLILFGLIYFSYIYGELVFRYYDPFVAFSHLGNEFDEIYGAYIILGIIVILSLFTKNWGCRYFCPLGGFFGIIRKISIFKLNQDEKSCTKCGICDYNCPVNLDIKNMRSANSAECISCMKCVGTCLKNSLSANILNKKVTRGNYNKIVVFGFFITLLIIIFFPFWQTKPLSNIKDENGIINVDNLKGSNTLEYLIKESGVPLEYYQEKLNLPKNIQLNSKLKHIGEDYEIKNSNGDYIETEDFREVTKEYFKIK